MPEVYLDSELVTFDGPAPESLSRVVKVLGPYLKEKELVLDSILVDGKELLMGDLSSQEGARMFTRVVVRTIHRSKYFLDRLEGVLDLKPLMKKKLKDFVPKVLSVRETECRDLSESLLMDVLELVKLGEELNEFGRKLNAQWVEPMTRLLGGFVPVMNLFTSALALRDPISLSELVKDSLSLLVEQILDLFEQEVKGLLLRECANHEAACQQS